MIKSGFTPCLPASGAKFQFPVLLKWFLGLTMAVLFTVAATAAPDQQNPDERFIHIMAVIDRADTLRKAGQVDLAKVKYREAQTNLVNFKANNPLYNPKTVAYRLKEVTDRLETKPVVVEPVAPAAKPKTNLEAEPSASASKSAVKLIDAGAEPRAILRFHPKAGDKQTVIATVKTSMEISSSGAAGVPMNMKLPAITIPMDLTIQSVAANGDITYELVTEEPSITADTNSPPQATEMIKTMFNGMKGLSGSGVMSSRGITKKISFKEPPGANSQTQQAIEQMKESMAETGVSFPEEAVGTGAKWEEDKPIKTQGMSAAQVSTYQLASVNGDSLNITFTITQTAGNQKIQNPAMGGMVNVLQMTANTTGTCAMDLSKFAASQFSADTHMESTSEITVKDKKQTITAKTDTNTGIVAQ